MKLKMRFRGVGEYELEFIGANAPKFIIKYEKFKGISDKFREFQDLLSDIFTSPIPEKRLTNENGAFLRDRIFREIKELGSIYECIRDGSNVLRTFVSEISSRNSGVNWFLPYYRFTLLMEFHSGCCLLGSLISVSLIKPVYIGCENDTFDVVDLDETAKRWIKKNHWEDCYVGSYAGSQLVKMLNEKVKDEYIKFTSKKG